MEGAVVAPMETDAVVDGAQPAGPLVYALYRANDHPRHFRFLHLAARGTATPIGPVVGLSVGWLAARLLSPAAPKRSGGGGENGGGVWVRFEGVFCDPYQGMQQGLEMCVPSDAVLREGAPPPRPVLSLLCVRWWDYWSVRYNSDFCVTSDGMLVDAFDGPGGPSEALRGEHEVFTAFIRCSEDLGALSECWAQQALSGTQRAAWYFLWPTAALPGPSSRKAGCVSERDFFALCERMERAGVRSAYPHPSQLYRLLAGKLWTPQMCLNCAFRVPPTTRVHFQEFAAGPLAAARGAIERLRGLSQELWGEVPEPASKFRGVVKLGFSWQGKDVKAFVGEASLAEALHTLLLQDGSRQLVCLVQKIVPKVICELRALVFRDAAGGGTDGSGFVSRKIYMKLWEDADEYHATGVEGFAMTSHLMVHSEDAPKAFFGGSTAVRDEIELQVDRLTRCWLGWFATECEEPPPQTRLDFLVSLEQPDLPQLWTCEVTECGSSLCGLKVGARNTAVLNFTMRHHDGSTSPTLQAEGRGFPRPLPELHWKEHPIT